MATMERAIASPFAIDDGVVTVVADAFVTLDSIAPWFDPGWEPQALAEIVLAYALNAPSAVLDKLVRIARRMMAWIERWDTVGWAEARGFVPLMERAA